MVKTIRNQRKKIRFEDLQYHFGKTAKEAASDLGISITQLKRVCRDCNIPRWPGRRIKSLQNKIRKLSSRMKKVSPQDAHEISMCVQILRDRVKLIKEDPGLIKVSSAYCDEVNFLQMTRGCQTLVFNPQSSNVKEEKPKQPRKKRSNAPTFIQHVAPPPPPRQRRNNKKGNKRTNPPHTRLIRFTNSLSTPSIDHSRRKSTSSRRNRILNVPPPPPPPSTSSAPPIHAAHPRPMPSTFSAVPPSSSSSMNKKEMLEMPPNHHQIPFPLFPLPPPPPPQSSSQSSSSNNNMGHLIIKKEPLTTSLKQQPQIQPMLFHHHQQQMHHPIRLSPELAEPLRREEPNVLTTPKRLSNQNNNNNNGNMMMMNNTSSSDLSMLMIPSPKLKVPSPDGTLSLSFEDLTLSPIRENKSRHHRGPPPRLPAPTDLFGGMSKCVKFQDLSMDMDDDDDDLDDEDEDNDDNDDDDMIEEDDSDLVHSSVVGGNGSVDDVVGDDDVGIESFSFFQTDQVVTFSPARRVNLSSSSTTFGLRNSMNNNDNNNGMDSMMSMVGSMNGNGLKNDDRDEDEDEDVDDIIEEDEDDDDDVMSDRNLVDTTTTSTPPGPSHHGSYLGRTGGRSKPVFLSPIKKIGSSRSLLNLNKDDLW